MTWSCAALDHGITLFANGKIAPCCVIDHNYRKNISDLKQGDPFADIKKPGQAPRECEVCTRKEANGIESYRNALVSDGSSGYQIVDLRHSNLCNLSCRICGPHFSSTWSKELGNIPHIQNYVINEYYDIITGPSVREIYFTGGEPLIIGEYWDILERLINTGQSKNIKLRYNSNLTTLNYKNKNIFDYWKEFKLVGVLASIDAVGPKLNSLRSGAKWEKIEENISQIINYKNSVNNFDLQIVNTLSNLNIWFLVELLEYFKLKNVNVQLNILDYPDFLNLSVLPDELKTKALAQIDQALLLHDDKNSLEYARQLIENNTDQHLFGHAISHVLLLDKLRGENLFDHLPFRPTAIKQILNNIG